MYMRNIGIVFCLLIPNMREEQPWTKVRDGLSAAEVSGQRKLCGGV